ncbi:heterokaryon incompatibility protein-domain-containing protein [Paraphoma chrysanthemicola]|uniref:Heterokaryon incompatibility protein-domain-containing protein n=1 Tax=Paraphoma chrysanthemicola TaxID=798071 RepID=A0A8K0R7C7_9PLEO|nr:heterokaryon incompatibility protein-domain-containing protein [Paraphoma chrysanthemicola]
MPGHCTVMSETRDLDLHPEVPQSGPLEEREAGQASASSPYPTIGNFQYFPEALSEPGTFRVLRLHPAARHTDPLCFDLEKACLDSPPRYDAISYTWDNQPFNIEAYCEGLRFLVTKNCARILSLVRRQHEDTLVWIDQICINQASNEDRDQNVAQMGEIYSSSRNVFIWTGEIEGSTKDLLARIVQDHLITMSECADFEGLIDDFYPLVEKEIERSSDHSDDILYNRFISRPWFHRMWTFQEFVRVKHDSIFFMSVDSLFWFPHIVRFEVFRGLTTSYHIGWLILFKLAVFGRSSTQWELSDLLETLLSRQCSDPRDKIFALYGLLKPLLQPSSGNPAQSSGGSEKLPFRLPSFKYSLPVATVYISAIAWALSVRQDAKILYLACYSSSEAAKRTRLSAHVTAGLPSWVPDLHFLSHIERPSAIRDPISVNEVGAEFYSASRSAALIYDRASENSICLKGVFCATIDYIGSEAQPRLGNDCNLESSVIPFCNSISAWLAECRDFYQLHPEVEGSVEKIARGTLTVACKIPGESPRDDELYERLEMTAMLAENPLYISEIFQSTELVKLYHHSSARIANRTLLISRWGPLGTGVGQFQLGDQVFAIAGLDDLLILRKLGDYYILVGHAYMDGLMKGEAWPENEGDLQDIEIK